MVIKLEEYNNVVECGCGGGKDQRAFTVTSVPHTIHCHTYVYIFKLYSINHCNVICMYNRSNR